MRSGPGAMMGTSGRTMQPKGRPQASFTVLASGMTASVNDVMRGRGAAAMVMREGGSALKGWEF